MSRFVKAFPGKGNAIIYFDQDGKRVEYRNGTPAWRNHNPKNLHSAPMTRRHNQIGKGKNNEAIFPDYESGHDALIDCLKTEYPNSSIPQTMRHFSPIEENPDLEAYIRFLLKKTGVTKDQKIKDLSPTQFKQL